MRVHITNIYGFIGTGAKAQAAVTEIAKKDLHFEELGIYRYPVETDTPEMLRTRLDGILASVGHGDVVIVQSPTWNDLSFDEQFMDRLNGFIGLGKIILIHDVFPLFLEAYSSYLKRYIDFYNRADVIIVPTQNMVDFLKANGLTVKKIVVQRMFDYVVSVDRSFKPPFRKVMNLAGNPNLDPKLKFCKEWDQDMVELAVTVDEGDWAKKRNVQFLGWFQDDHLLLDALRRNGGFGLLWVEDDPYWSKYIKLNASYKFSTYLAAGIPVIVPSGVGEQDTILRKKLGLVVDSLNEAAERIECMREEEYREMADNVDTFSYLLQDGFFTRKMLVDAIHMFIYGDTTTLYSEV